MTFTPVNPDTLAQSGVPKYGTPPDDDGERRSQDTEGSRRDETSPCSGSRPGENRSMIWTGALGRRLHPGAGARSIGS